MNVKELMKEYLHDEGYKVNEEDFGLAFRYQGRNIIFNDNSDDETFFSLTMANIYEAKEEEVPNVLKVCNDICAERKVIKAILNSDRDVWLHFEILIDTTPELSDIVPRALNMLLQGRLIFYKKLEELENKE